MKSAQERAEKAVDALTDDFLDNNSDENRVEIILRSTNLPALVKCAKALDQIVNSEPGAEDWCSARQTLEELNQNDK